MRYYLLSHAVAGLLAVVVGLIMPLDLAYADGHKNVQSQRAKGSGTNRVDAAQSAVLFSLPGLVAVQDAKAMTAEAIRTRVAAVYAECRTYQDEGTLSQTMAVPGQPPASPPYGDATFSTSFVRPDQFLFDFHFNDVAQQLNGAPQTNRTVIWSTKEGPRQWWKIGNRVEKPDSLDSALRVMKGGVTNASPEIPGLLFRKPKSASPGWGVYLTDFKQPTLLDPIKVDGNECYQIEERIAVPNFQTGRSFDEVTTYAIDKKSFLIRRYRHEMIDPELRATETITYRPRINMPIPDTVFSFRPPAPSDVAADNPQANRAPQDVPVTATPAAPELDAAYLTPERKANNLLKNGSFESGEVPWELQSWRRVPDAAKIVEGIAHDGPKSVRLIGKNDDVSYCQATRVEPGRRYLFSGWVKTEDVTINEPRGRYGANLAILGGVERSPSFVGTGDWQYAALAFESGPRAQVDLCARLGHHGSTCSGTAWFDDLCLLDLGVSTSSSASLLILSGPPEQMEYTPDGSRLVTCGKSDAGIDPQLTVWDTATGRPLASWIEKPDGNVFGIGLSLATSADSRLFVTGGEDGQAQVWDLVQLSPRGETLVMARPIESPPRALTMPLRFEWLGRAALQRVEQVLFSPDGKTVATCAAAGGPETDLHVRTWDAATGLPLSQLQPVPAGYRLKLAADGRTLVPPRAALMPWIEEMAKGRSRLPAFSRYLTFSRDARRVAVSCGGVERLLHLWEIASEKPIGLSLRPEGPEFEAFFDRPLRMLTEHLRGAQSVSEQEMFMLSPPAFSMDGKMVAVAVVLMTGHDGGPGQLWVWDTTTGHPACPPVPLTDKEMPSIAQPLVLAFHPDGTKVAVATQVQSTGRHGEVRIYSLSPN